MLFSGRICEESDGVGKVTIEVNALPGFCSSEDIWDEWLGTFKSHSRISDSATSVASVAQLLESSVNPDLLLPMCFSCLVSLLNCSEAGV